MQIWIIILQVLGIINVVSAICSNINELAYEVRNKNPELYEDLQNIKSNLFFGQNIVNTFTLGRLVQIMRSHNYLSTNDIWQFVHPKIIELSKSIQDEYNKSYIGKTVKVLVEEGIDGFYRGHTDNYLYVNFESQEQDLENKIVNVKIERERNEDLYGKNT